MRRTQVVHVRRGHSDILHSSRRLWLLVFLLLGATFRWGLWSRFRLREDEALYGYWGWLIYAHLDVMLRNVPVDKPPLFPYLLSWLYEIFRPSEETLRLPALLGSTVAFPLMYAWTRDLLGRVTARAALLLYALLPLSVLLAPTGYMDALMVGWTLLAAWAAARRRPHPVPWALTSGVTFGLAVATKPLALLWIPLLWGTAWIRKQRMRYWLPAWGAGVLVPLWRWWQWEQYRGRPFTWEMGIRHYGGIGLVPLVDLPTRLQVWWPVILAAWGGWVPFLLAWGLALVGARVAWSQGKNRWAPTLLWGWLLGNSVLFLMVRLSPWDRYLLLLAPVWAALVGHGWQWIVRRKSRWRWGCVVLALWVGFQAGMAHYPVGGDHGAYDGIDDVAAYIMVELPPGGILYHHWLGWHYGFYLFGAPYDYRWWPDISWLVQDASRGDHIPRLLVFPAWHERARWQAVKRLRAAGVGLHLTHRVYGRDGRVHFWIYQITK